MGETICTKKRSKSFHDFRIKSLEKVYPDLAIWKRIPLNRILDRFSRKATLKPENALEEACIEELSVYLWSVLKSVERNRPVYMPAFDEDMHAELLKYFWDGKRLPTPRGVIDYYEARRKPIDLEIAISSE